METWVPSSFCAKLILPPGSRLSASQVFWFRFFCAVVFKVFHIHIPFYAPLGYMPGSDIKVWWPCPDCNDSYSSAVSKRVSGTGCPKCGAEKSTAKRSKPIQMIDMKTNEVINTFSSISEASRQMKISSGNITAVCKGNERKHAGGYYWRYV